MNDEPKRFTVMNHNGPNYRFTGWLLCEHTTDPHETRDRWQETKLYETVGGAYVAVLMQRSLAEQGHDRSKATVIPAPIPISIMSDMMPDTRKPDQTIQAEQEAQEFARRLAVMDALDWTPCARAMVRKIGWKSWSVDVY